MSSLLPSRSEDAGRTPAVVDQLPARLNNAANFLWDVPHDVVIELISCAATAAALAPARVDAM